MSTVNYESVSLFTLTPGGQLIARRLQQYLPLQCYCAEKYIQDGFIPFNHSLKRTVADAFKRDSAIIFVGACGIAVRMIASLLNDKFTDPAVLVVDEKGQNVISLVSGHIGGANELARYVSALIGANPVITTATDVNQTCSLDLLAQQMCADAHDLRHAVKTINQLLVSHHKVGLVVDPRLREQIGFDIDRFDTRGLVLTQADDVPHHQFSALVDVSMQAARPDWPVPSVQLVPKRVVAGIGCRKGVPPLTLQTLFSQRMQQLNLHPLSLVSLGSINIKHDEPAIIELARQYRVPLKLYSARELQHCAQHFPSSEFVRKTVGVGSVSQPVAWLLSQGRLLGSTLRQQGITITYGVMK